MLDSLLIQNFKIFKELKIKSLTKVNLFVGKNNTGKSCLLEAVYSYANLFQNINELIVDRDQDWEILLKEKLDYSESPVRHIFYGYHFPYMDEPGITIGTLNEEKNKIKLLASVYKYVKNDIGEYSKKLVAKKDLDVYSHAIEVIFDDQPVTFIWTDKGYPVEYRKYNIEDPLYRKRLKEFSMNIQNIPAQNNTAKAISTLWDEISLTNLEHEVISCLRIIEPKISGIALIGEPSGRGRIPIIKCEDSEERLPLKTFGDGMTRLLNVILALVNAKDGILLIDEAENGLHWSVHSKLWSLIFRLANKLNVQVFATTHSMDCVKGFNKIWIEEEYKDSGCFYRLERGKDTQIKAVYYNQETLSDSIETGVEFR